MGLALGMAVLPSLYAREWASFKWSCHRSGERAGECYADPTLRDRLGIAPPSPLKKTTSYPIVRAYQTIKLDDIDIAFPLRDGSVLLLPKCVSGGEPCARPTSDAAPDVTQALWEIPVTVSDEPVTFEEIRAFIDGFAAFQQDEKAQHFVHHPTASYRPWWIVSYLASAFFVALAISRVRSGVGKAPIGSQRAKKKLRTPLEADREGVARSRASDRRRSRA